MNPFVIEYVNIILMI